MSIFLHHLLFRLCVRLYYRGPRLLAPATGKAAGAVLFVALHRNGAVDGFIYETAVGHLTFMISTQLRRTWLGRLFFHGIEVARPQDRRDGEREENGDAMEKARLLLAEGGRFCIFPEGTSNLGHRHLPFRSGAARLLAQCLERGIPVTLIPLGIHYQCAWSFGSLVEVVAGAPFLPEREGVTGHVLILRCKEWIRQGLEEVGVDFPSQEVQRQVEPLAVLASEVTGTSLFPWRKAWQQGPPPPLAVAWEEWLQTLRGKPCLLEGGIPLYPRRGLLAEAVGLAFLGPVALAAMVANGGPLVAAWWAGVRFPDGQNVVTLWRLLVGVPLLALWGAGLAAAAFLLGRPLWFAGYFALTWAGLHAWPRARRRGVALANALLFPQGGALFRELVALLSRQPPPSLPALLDNGGQRERP